MFTWIILLTFGLPLVVFILNHAKQKKARENRLKEIKDRLREKEIEKVSAKWDRIKK